MRNVHALLSTVLRDAVPGGAAAQPVRRDPAPQRAEVGGSVPVTRADRPAGAGHSAGVQGAGADRRRHRHALGELAGLPRTRLDLLRRRIEVAQTLVDVGGVLSFGEPKAAQSRRYVSLPPTLVTALDCHSSEFVFTK